LGGDEVAAVLPHCDAAKARGYAENAARHVHSWVAEGHHISVTAGIACDPDGTLKGHDLLRQADDALYRGKHRQKGSVVVADG